MNAVNEWLRTHKRSVAWLAREMDMLPQTLGNKLRGMNDEQIMHTISLSEWYQIQRITGLPCPVCSQQSNED